MSSGGYLLSYDAHADMRERSRKDKEGCMREMRRLFSGWAASFLAHTQHVAMQAAHGARAAADRTGRQGYVSIPSCKDADDGA